VYKYQDGTYVNESSIATIVGNQITLHLTDGGQGDADGVANGVIVDPIIPVGSSISQTTTTLPGGTLLQAYAATLAVSGGNPPYHWTLTSGALPLGMHLSGVGVISGKPKVSGTYSFTVKVVDHKSKTHTQLTVTRVFSLTVTQPQPTVTLVKKSSGPAAGATKVSITGTALSGATVVNFGSGAATDITVNAAGTKITAYTPAADPGPVDVVVTTPGGKSSTSPADVFTFTP
jgi:hypothetical protein